MYKVNQEEKLLIPLARTQFSSVGVLERFDLQEWIDGTPAILGEDIFIIAKELPLPSGIRLDLLGLDRQGKLVVIELKRDSSGRDVVWQAIKYASYCSNFLPEDIYRLAAAYLQKDEDEAQLTIEEFIDVELDDRLIQNPKNDALTKLGRQGGNTQINLVAANGDLDPAVLGHPPFRNIERGDHLEP